MANPSSFFSALGAFAGGGGAGGGEPPRRGMKRGASKSASRSSSTAHSEGGEGSEQDREMELLTAELSRMRPVVTRKKARRGASPVAGRIAASPAQRSASRSRSGGASRSSSGSVRMGSRPRASAGPGRFDAWRLEALGDGYGPLGWVYGRFEVAAADETELALKIVASATQVRDFIDAIIASSPRIEFPSANFGNQWKVMKRPGTPWRLFIVSQTTDVTFTLGDGDIDSMVELMERCQFKTHGPGPYSEATYDEDYETYREYFT